MRRAYLRCAVLALIPKYAPMLSHSQPRERYSAISASMSQSGSFLGRPAIYSHPISAMMAGTMA